MKALQTRFEVLMDDGTDSFEVLTDQRDYAAYEGSEEYQEDGSRQATKLRYLCWSAMRRSGKTKATWQKFNEGLCIQVALLGMTGQEDREGEESEDPSQG